MLTVNNEMVPFMELPAMDRMIPEEPKLVKKIADFYLQKDHELSLYTSENTSRMHHVYSYFRENAREIYSQLNSDERLLVYILNQCFGWLVFEQIDSMIGIISMIYKFDAAVVRKTIESLMGKFLLFKLERLKRYNLLFAPKVFLDSIAAIMEEEGYAPTENEENIELGELREELSTYQHITLIAGMLSYIVTFSPRSSETNEIHKIDFVKMSDYFSDFAPKERIDNIIKKLSQFGFFEKLNNRIVVNKNIFERIVSLSVNEQLFIVFLYKFMDKFDFKKSYFMTLKILANRPNGLSLRELFFYFLNCEMYFVLKNEVKNLKQYIQHQELKFTFFVKALENENIAAIKRSDEGSVSIAKDYIIMNEPHSSLLKNADFSAKFKNRSFIVEPNYEVIVEPYLKPKVLLKLAVIAEPVTIQTISIFKITKESIYRSFAYGIKKDEILKFLAKHSKHELPENVVTGIESFIGSLDIHDMKQYKIIQLNSQESSQVKENFKNKVIEIEPHTFLVFDLEVLKSIEEYCKKNGFGVKYVEDFLNGDNFFYRMHENTLLQNIRHLHTMKEFFDFYGNSFVGTKVKLDNEI
ncbi:MAG: hypothetical protein HPY53_00160 [Brevinematales bacterium]|nr:hypothetical protein [Brevinematales bacterium]